jgi:hypothetical protein
MTSKTGPTKTILQFTKRKVSMVFWKGGKLSETDFICCNGERLKSINSFRHLCVTLLTSGKSFKQHVKAALRAMHDIENLRLLSLETAMKLFSAKVAPILIYGLEQIWDHLTVNDLTTFENVKATYFKRAVCLSRFTETQLSYTMAGEPFVVEKLRNVTYCCHLQTKRKNGRICEGSSIPLKP